MSDETNDAILEAPAASLSGRVAELARRQRPPKCYNVVTGWVLELNEAHIPMVDFHANPDSNPLPARSILPLKKGAIGREVALMFENGDFRKPIVMGLMENPEMAKEDSEDSQAVSARKAMEEEIDGERLVFTAGKEIVLRCGEASITLTQAGKVLICGKFLLNRSSGVIRIKGGSVQIN
jgi:hypothetical protein